MVIDLSRDGFCEDARRMYSLRWPDDPEHKWLHVSGPYAHGNVAFHSINPSLVGRE
jgi:hypothetical protein